MPVKANRLHIKNHELAKPNRIKDIICLRFEVSGVRCQLINAGVYSLLEGVQY